jgi:hypothetical protein
MNLSGNELKMSFTPLEEESLRKESEKEISPMMREVRRETRGGFPATSDFLRT